MCVAALLLLATIGATTTENMMAKRNAQSKEVSAAQLGGLVAAVNSCADACKQVRSEMDQHGLDSIKSSNFSTAIYGLGLLLNFCEGIAGTLPLMEARKYWESQTGGK